MTDDLFGESASQWDNLHAQPRFRPVYPSESVVRFIARRFGGVTDAPSRPSHLLDIGCGAGRHTFMMLKAGHYVDAVDISEEGLRALRKRLKEEGHSATCTNASMTNLPFDSSTFDGAVAYGVFNYGTHQHFADAVSEAHRVLRRDGHLLCVTRSTLDQRMTLGKVVGPDTVRLDSDETNEAGILMYFLDPERVDLAFSSFRSVRVDRIDHSSGGGAFMNSDLVIEATK